jgi:DNA-binding transcriptional ArsR family regulator
MAKHEPNLNLIFQALCDPTRRAMLARLAEGPLPVSELALPTGFALPTVMRHLSVLERADLVHSEKTGRTRTCRTNPAALAATLDWMVQQRALWEQRTDRLEAYVATLMKRASL